MYLFITVFVLLISVAVWVVVSLIAKNMAWKVFRIRFILISVFIAVGYVGLRFFIGREFPDVARWMNNFMGFLTLAFCFSLIYWCVFLLLKLAGKQRWLEGKHIVLVLAAIVSIFSALGSYNYHKDIAVEEFTITSKKITKSYRFVQISDIQYGTSTRQEMDRILDLAYQQNADFIVFTGDLVDFNYYRFEDFEKLAASPVPIYFERGNHEFYHHPKRLLSYLKKLAPLEVLINRSVNFEEIQIIGLDFNRAPNNVEQQLQRIKVDPNQLSILLYHEPRDVEVAASYGIDILLYGHTHAGQMWPYTWVVDWMYKYSDGVFKVDDSFVYTSDGASLWGPRMRLGSQNEIVVFNVIPKR
ncbi:MAG: metallophosphoesterase [Arenicella sp.]